MTEFQQHNLLSPDTAVPIAGAGSSTAEAPVGGASYYAWTWAQILATVLDIGVPDPAEVTGQPWTVIQHGGQVNPGLHLIWSAQWNTSPNAGGTSIQVYLSPALYTAGGAWDRLLNAPAQALSGVPSGSYGALPMNPQSFEPAKLAVAGVTTMLYAVAQQFSSIRLETLSPSAGFKGSGADVLVELLGDLGAVTTSLHDQMTTPVVYSDAIGTAGDSAAQFLSDIWAAYTSWTQVPEHSPLGALVQVLEEIAVPDGGAYEIPDPQQTRYGDLTTDGPWQLVEQQAKSRWNAALSGSSDFTGLDVLGRVALGNLVGQYASTTSSVVPVIGPAQPTPQVPGGQNQPSGQNQPGGPGNGLDAKAQVPVPVPVSGPPVPVPGPPVPGPGLPGPGVAGLGVAAAVVGPGVAGSGGAGAAAGPGFTSAAAENLPRLDAVSVNPVINPAAQVPPVAVLGALPGGITGSAGTPGRPAAGGIPTGLLATSAVAATTAGGVLGGPDTRAAVPGDLPKAAASVGITGLLDGLPTADGFTGTIGRLDQGAADRKRRERGRSRARGRNRRTAPAAGFSLGSHPNGSVLEQSVVPAIDGGRSPAVTSSVLNSQLIPGGPAGGVTSAHGLAGDASISRFPGPGDAMLGTGMTGDPGTVQGPLTAQAGGTGHQMMVMPGSGMGRSAQRDQERERLVYLPEEEEYWGTEPGLPGTPGGPADQGESHESEYGAGPAVAVGIGADDGSGRDDSHESEYGAGPAVAVGIGADGGED